MDWPSELLVPIDNTGDIDLSISFSSSTNVFSVSSILQVVKVDKTASFKITFTPRQVKSYAGEIIIAFAGKEERITVTGAGDLITSVDNGKIAIEDVIVYPNPASTEVIVDLTAYGVDKPSIEFVSPDGKLLLSIEKITEDKVTINTAKYPSGMYLIRLTNGDGVLTRKVVIKK